MATWIAMKCGSAQPYLPLQLATCHLHREMRLRWAPGIGKANSASKLEGSLDRIGQPVGPRGLVSLER